MRHAIVAGFAYFFVVFAAGFLLGLLRVSLLSPLLGETAAVLIELPIILGIAWLACRRLVTAFEVARQLSPRLVMGGMAFLMLMGAELVLSVFAFGRTAADYLTQFREIHALIGLAGQVAFGLFPVVQLNERH